MDYVGFWKPEYDLCTPRKRDRDKREEKRGPGGEYIRSNILFAGIPYFSGVHPCDMINTVGSFSCRCGGEKDHSGVDEALSLRSAPAV